jgi:hypothetical protein
MKKLYYTLLAALAITGCSKESTKPVHNSQPSATLQAVTFNVDDFGLTTGNITTNSIKGTAALKDQIKYLQYATLKVQESTHSDLFDLSSYQEHQAVESGFGTIKDALQDSRYHFNFVGADVLGKVQMESIPLSGGLRLPVPTYTIDKNLLSSKIFYAYLDTTIAGKPLNKPIVMKRMVSEVIIHLNDAIPANAAKMVLSFTDYPLSFDLSRGYGLERGRQDEYYPTAKFEFPVKQDKIGQKDVELCAIVLPYYYPEVAIDCLDAKGNVIAHRILPKNDLNVYTRLEKNTQYKYSGSLFGNEIGFAVSVDTKWNTPVTSPFSMPGTTQVVR